MLYHYDIRLSVINNIIPNLHDVGLIIVFVFFPRLAKVDVAKTIDEPEKETKEKPEKQKIENQEQKFESLPQKDDCDEDVRYLYRLSVNWSTHE